MEKILIAILYIAAILFIGVMAGRKVKTADEFAVADRNIPFWTNVFSMSSAWIGAGSTLGCASMCYAYGISGFYLAIGVGLGSVLASVVFAKRIRMENVTTIPELIRKHLGKTCADAIALLAIFSTFSVVASQVRSLGTILNMFIPSLPLLTAMIIMTVIMLIYTVIGGMTAATKTDKLNIGLMVLAVMIILPILSLVSVGGVSNMAKTIQAAEPLKMKVAGMVGWGTMISSGLYFGCSGMVNSENFLRVCGARSAKEAQGASLVGTLMIYFPYLLFASLVGLVGSALLPGLASSDAVLPAMIDKFAGPLLGAVLLAALLAAVMGTAASVTMLTSVTISRDIIGRFKRDMTDKQMLTTQRILMILVAVAGLLVGYFGSSIVSIMEDVGAPSGAALVPIFCGLFFWRKKMNPKGSLITIGVAVASTLIYWAAGSPLGISHFLFGLACSTVTMFVANSICYKPVPVMDKQ
ncbi:sodium:solute symporter family protein [Feifania hominis]|uniref:Sodium:solute symporter family protein n=1 Tax=Feifania hominis TaxID=2763660 RepID=A0A926DDH2_9FIRM|nr:sodium:solute symporter family protein [Feifania hominis]MBC8535837.1 sodium:solute symporter family protein [Feifania hominis]